MKFFKNFKVKLLVALILIATLLTTFSYAEENVTDEAVNGEVSVTATSEDTNTEVQSTDTETNNEDTNTTTSTVKEGDLFLTGDSVTIDYPVSGNMFIFANDVTINHNVDGNIFVFANSLTVGSNAYVYSDLFVCANEVTIAGTVYDVYSLSTRLTLETSTYIVRDITAKTSTLTLSGYVRRNANLSFDTIQVDETYTLIDGDLNYSATSQSIPESIVSGSINYTEGSGYSEEPSKMFQNYLKELLQVLVVAIIIVLIVVFATPKFTNKMHSILENKAAATLGCGALTLILVPVLCFILFCTVVGIIPALALLFTFIFIISISPIILSIPLAKIVCEKMKKESKGLTIVFALLFVVIIWLLEQIPVLGILVALFVSLFGLGIITYSIFRPAPKKNDNIVAKASAVIDSSEDKKEKVNKSKKDKEK